MAMLKTYDLRGNKLSFANWISNLSPTETPFTSMIGKEAIDQVFYSWQVDRLSPPSNTAMDEGAIFAAENRPATQVMENCTQILRKIVRVTDTANKIGLYGRASEKAYQMEKAGKEIRRDLEHAVLRNGSMILGNKIDAARGFAGFSALVAHRDLADTDTGAIVNKSYIQPDADSPEFTSTEIFDITYNLYLAGAKANKIMFHPKHMRVFSHFIGHMTGSYRMFDGLDNRFNVHVGKLRDPLGQEFTLIPNRHMPENKLYFFNEKDWTQMILRAPDSVQLAKNGSSEKHMIEMEVGLRHRNPFASGILELKPHGSTTKGLQATVTHKVIGPAGSNPHQTKLMLQALKDGAKDDTATDKINILIGPDATGLTAPSASVTLTTGTAEVDLTGVKPGFYTVTCHNDADSMVASVEVQVHSTRSAPVTLEEKLAEAKIEAPVAAAKGRKAK